VYLSSFRIRGIKCFEEEQEFVFPQRQDGRHAGWHVILGANASGKTTVLRAIAMCLLGPSLKILDPVGWVRSKQGNEKPTYGAFDAKLTKGEEDIAETNQKGPFVPRLYVTPDDVIEINGDEYDRAQYVNGSSEPEKKKLLKSVYASKKAGWFSCGYGPFRRLSGGDEAILNTLTHPRQHRFASLYYESIALSKCEPWLINLHHQAVDKDSIERESAIRTLSIVKTIINALLPKGVRIHGIAASPTGVQFADSWGTIVHLSDLSDGYRSFLALAMDILRQLADVYGEKLGSLTEDVPVDGSMSPHLTMEKRITAEGVVLIDEVDAHLHPSWQRTIGFMLQKVFPNIQFIVSTHSPFVVQAASEGGLFVLRSTPTSNSVRVIQPIKSVRGWRAEAILTSELFGLEETVDTETEEVLREYHRLSTKRSFGQLSQEEQDKLDQLEARVARELTAPGETMDEVRRRRDMEAYVDETIGKLRSSNAEKSL
jgi:hypothetical protein